MNSPTFCIDRRSDVIDFSQLQRDYATYLPAISRGYADAVIKPLRRNAPVSSVDLNFFDPETSLFYLPFALYSAGQADLSSKTPCSVSERDKANTFVLGDSGGYSLTPQRYSVSMERMPDAKAYIGSDIPFPWRSPIGERLTLGDLCVKNSGVRAWDQVTDHMMMNHNLFMQMDAIIAANRVFELESGDAKKYCSERLLKIRDVIAKAFTEEDWDTFLERERRVLEISGKNEPEGLGARGDF